MPFTFGAHVAACGIFARACVLRLVDGPKTSTQRGAGAPPERTCGVDVVSASHAAPRPCHTSATSQCTSRVCIDIPAIPIRSGMRVGRL